MTNPRTKQLAALLCLLCLGGSLPAAASDDQSRPTVEEMSRLRQNPVSGLRSVYLQLDATTVDGKNADAFSLQTVWPFRVSNDWKLITYTIMPVVHLPELVPGEGSTQGLGNIQFNGFFRPEKTEGSLVWGLGPAIQLPTRTDSELGSSQVSVGPAALLFGTSGAWSAGLVAQNIWSLGGTRPNKVNEFAAQYIFAYNFSDGWYLSSNATITADWRADSKNRWTIPVGGGLGKTFQIAGSKHFYSAALQGFYNVRQPELVGRWSVMAQFQIMLSQ